jgi:hypothetical protein
MSDLKVLQTMNSFPMWKTIKLGTYKDADDLLKTMKKKGVLIGEWANDIIHQPAFTVSPKKTNVELVKATVDDLGFKKGAARKDIYKSALKLGLELCPNEVGPQLRLQYKDQPYLEWLLVAMEPITSSNGRLAVFAVFPNYPRFSNYTRLALHGHDAHPDYFWDDDYCFVFARRK